MKDKTNPKESFQKEENPKRNIGRRIRVEKYRRLEVSGRKERGGSEWKTRELSAILV